jgi:hypothetical protein
MVLVWKNRGVDYRKVLLGISVTLLSLGLVACGTTEENTSSTQEEVEESTEMAEEEDKRDKGTGTVPY